MFSNLTRTLAVGVFAATALCANAQADHLLLSEVGISAAAQITGFSSEYVEIFNPTNASIPLDNYYISDNNNYKLLPNTPTGLAGGTTDNFLKFPAGAVLLPGQVAVVTGGGRNFLDAFYNESVTYDDYHNLRGEPLLFEVGETDDAILNMSFLNTGGAVPEETANFNLTNPSATNGEFVVLFHWDGITALVQDVDIVTWGGQTSGGNRFASKSSPYLQDAGNHDNLSAGNTNTFEMIYRVSITEADEVATGGNGITSHDESTETAATSWATGNLGNDLSPGVTNLVLPGENLLPIISGAQRNIQYPSLSDEITITANVTDVDGTIDAVTVFLSAGATFVPYPAVETTAGVWSAVVGPFGDGSDDSDVVVEYYIQATDSTNNSNFFPALAPAENSAFIVSDDHIEVGDIVINEVVYDKPGSDTYEFIELHNVTTRSVSLAHFRVADGNLNYFRLPLNAEIPASGYMLLSLELDLFLADYPEVAGVPYYDWGNFGLNNGGDRIVVLHPHEFVYENNTTFIDDINYSSVAPWPANVAGTSQSLELIYPRIDNALPAIWGTADPLATPGMQNSIYNPAQLLGFSRDAEYPGASQAVTITAMIQPRGSATISEVTLHVDSNSDSIFEPVVMSPTANADEYSAVIGGFPDDSVVKYYFEVENSLGEFGVFPNNAPGENFLFIVDDTPIQAGDLVVNEILYDKIGTDTYEWFELYNNTVTTISLGQIRVQDSTDVYFTFPEGAEIGPDSYVLLSYNPTNMAADYEELNAEDIYQYPFSLSNTSDSILITHPNAIGFNDVVSSRLDEVMYTNESPWPVIDANVTGRSIELNSPELDNNVGSNWTGSVAIEGDESGTPGAPNNTTSDVSNWSIY